MVSARALGRGCLEGRRRATHVRDLGELGALAEHPVEVEHVVADDRPLDVALARRGWEARREVKGKGGPRSVVCRRKLTLSVATPDEKDRGPALKTLELRMKTRLDYVGHRQTPLVVDGREGWDFKKVEPEARWRARDRPCFFGIPSSPAPGSLGIRLKLPLFVVALFSLQLSEGGSSRRSILRSSSWSALLLRESFPVVSRGFVESAQTMKNEAVAGYSRSSKHTHRARAGGPQARDVGG